MATTSDVEPSTKPKIQRPFSLAKLFREGYGSDVTITAEGKTFKFHRPILEACSEAFATALEVDTNIELKISAVTLSHVHSILYGTVPNQKTPLSEIWLVYRFADQYCIQYITAYLTPVIIRLINKTLASELLELLRDCTSDFALPFVEPAIDCIVLHMELLGDDIKFCKDKTCCRHTPYTCVDVCVCCVCSLEYLPDAKAYRNAELDKILDIVETLPKSIRQAIFRAMASGLRPSSRVAAQPTFYVWVAQPEIEYSDPHAQATLFGD